MSMRTLETQILASSRVYFCNPKLRLKDILEWSTGDVDVKDGEVVGRIGDGLNVQVAIAAANDKRKGKTA